MVGRALGDLGLEVEALDGAGGGGEVLQAADGGCMEISWVNEMAHVRILIDTSAKPPVLYGEKPKVIFRRAKNKVNT